MKIWKEKSFEVRSTAKRSRRSYELCSSDDRGGSEEDVNGAEGMWNSGRWHQLNNYLYLGESPVKQAQKAVKLLNLNASTVASLAGVKLERPGEKGASSSSKMKPPEPKEPPRQFTREKEVKKKEDAKKK